MLKKPPKTIILIDDSSLDNRLHKRVIERTGLVDTVLTFSMAEDAMEYFRSPGGIPADLVFLDINMPRMDGFEMLNAATEEFGPAFDPSVIVMLTTSLNPSDKARAASYDVIKGYLQKPLNAEKFSGLMTALSGGAKGTLQAPLH